MGKYIYIYVHIHIYKYIVFDMASKPLKSPYSPASMSFFIFRFILHYRGLIQLKFCNQYLNSNPVQGYRAPGLLPRKVAASPVSFRM